MSNECLACRGTGYLVDACPDCGGNSAYESHSCGRCEGRGQIECPVIAATARARRQQLTTCDVAIGTGQCACRCAFEPLPLRCVEMKE